MSRSSNQKLKLLYLMKILLERTDQNHTMTVAQMIEALSHYGISAERKSIYDDLEALRIYGLDLVCRRSKTHDYFVASRTFELPELKLLVDAVQASRFITLKKSEELIKKLESLSSVYEARSLQRQVYVGGRIKNMNESIYYNIDQIHTAISANYQISFRYFDWTIGKKKKYRHDGKIYRVSPYALTWDNDFYYLIAYDASVGFLKHYRVDRMNRITSTGEPRQGQECFAKCDVAAYTNKIFDMFSGEEMNVTLEFAGHLIGVVFDRFGRDITVVPQEEGRFRIAVQVAVSPTFLGWLMQFGTQVRVISPEKVARQAGLWAREIAQMYGEE